MAGTATLLPLPNFIAYTSDGAPASGGYVTTYLPNGTTPATTWQDAAETIPNSNPILLNAVGACKLYGQGQYYLQTMDSNGNNLPAYSGLTQDTASSTASTVMVSITNIASLRAATTTTLPQTQCYVLGYYAGADGGEGPFWYNAGDTTTADNGGTIIVDGSGRRWYREGVKQGVTARQFGAQGNNAANDAPALQAAINWCEAHTGPLMIEGGSYSLSTGLLVDGNGLRIIGASDLQAELTAGSANIFVLTITGVSNQLENIVISNPLRSTAVCGTLSLNAAVETKCTAVLVSGGWYPLLIGNGSTDNSFWDCKFENSYGSANVFMQTMGGAYFYRCKIDQDWPLQLPIQGNLFGAWAASTAYTGADVVSTGGYFLQCTGGGTSGVSPPVITTYGTPIIDGTSSPVTWQLAGAVNLNAVNADTGSSVLVFYNCDFTGSYLSSFLISNSAAGTSPQDITLTDCVFGQALSSLISAQAGAGLRIKGGSMANVVETGGAGIFFGAGWDSDASIIGLLGQGGMDYGILNGGGVNLTVSDNQIYGCSTAALYTASGVSGFSFVDNKVGASPTWGANAAAITVASGASNNYIITLNTVTGATTGITDGGTGGNKYVLNNI